MSAPDPVGTTIPAEAFTLGIWCTRCSIERLLYVDTIAAAIEEARECGWRHTSGNALCPDCVREVA